MNCKSINFFRDPGIPICSLLLSAFPETRVSYLCAAVVKREEATWQNRARQRRERDCRERGFVFYVLYHSYIHVYHTCFECFAAASGKAQQERGLAVRFESKIKSESRMTAVPVPAISRGTLRKIMLLIIPRTSPLVHVRARIFQLAHRRHEHGRTLCDISEKRCAAVRRSGRLQT